MRARKTVGRTGSCGNSSNDTSRYKTFARNFIRKYKINVTSKYYSSWRRRVLSEQWGYSRPPRTTLSLFTPSYIFNFDESGLNYRCLSSYDRSASRDHRETASTSSKNRVTMALCVNADGSVKMKPLVIGTAKQHRCLPRNLSVPIYVDGIKKIFQSEKVFLSRFFNCPSHVF